MQYIMNQIRISTWLGVLCTSVLLVQDLCAQVVKLHGATTTEKIVSSQKQAIETRSGVKLEIVGNGAGRGLADLCSGQTDIALLGGPLKGVAEAMNKEKAGSVDITDLKEIPLTKAKISFITNPSAGVKTLTDAQAGDILTGKVSNWKEVGGADLPIKVVIPFGADGARITLQETLLKGTPYSKDAILRNSSKDIALVVSQLAGTCAMLSAQNAVGSVSVVALETEYAVPLGLVVKGEPAGDIKKVVEAAQALIH